MVNTIDGKTSHLLNICMLALFTACVQILSCPWPVLSLCFWWLSLSEMSYQSVCCSDLLYCSCNWQLLFVFFALLSMIDELKKQTFKHSWWMLVCFEIQLILSHNSPLPGVEFNELVSSDLQILDSQRWLPSGWASFLGLSPSKANPGCSVLMIDTQTTEHCCWIVHEEVTSSFSTTDWQIKRKVLFFFAQ